MLGSLGGRGPVCGFDVPGPEVCLGLGGVLGRGQVGTGPMYMEWIEDVEYLCRCGVSGLHEPEPESIWCVLSKSGNQFHIDASGADPGRPQSTVHRTTYMSR